VAQVTQSANFFYRRSISRNTTHPHSSVLKSYSNRIFRFYAETSYLHSVEITLVDPLLIKKLPFQKDSFIHIIRSSWKQKLWQLTQLLKLKEYIVKKAIPFLLIFIRSNVATRVCTAYFLHTFSHNLNILKESPHSEWNYLKICTILQDTFSQKYTELNVLIQNLFSCLKLLSAKSIQLDGRTEAWNLDSSSTA